MTPSDWALIFTLLAVAIFVAALAGVPQRRRR